MTWKTMLLAAALAVSSALPAAAQEYRLRFTTSQVNPNEPIVKAMKLYAERVQERSGGKIAIDVLTGDQLGAQKKVNEMILSGASLMSATDYGQLSNFVPDLGVVAGPYVFKDVAASDKLFASGVYAEMAAKLEQQGIKVLMPNGLFGLRHVIGSKPVRSPADLAGVTVRVPSSPVMVATFTKFGARPTELPWGDVYNALQTNVVDAAEAPFGSIAGAKLSEVRKVISKTGHQMMFTAWVTSAALFDKLDPELQVILLEEGKKIAPELTKMTLDTDASYAEELQKAGVEIVDDVDVPAFQEAASTAFEAVPNLTPGIVDRVRAAVAD